MSDFEWKDREEWVDRPSAEWEDRLDVSISSSSSSSFSESTSSSSSSYSSESLLSSSSSSSSRSLSSSSSLSYSSSSSSSSISISSSSSSSSSISNSSSSSSSSSAKPKHFVQDGTKREYITTIGDNALLRVGGKDENTGGKFVPNMNAESGKYWLNFNAKFAVVTSEVEYYHDGMVEIRIGNATFRYYISLKETLKCEIELHAKPVIVGETLNLELELTHSPNLVYRYNPANGSYAFVENPDTAFFEVTFGGPRRFCRINRPCIIGHKILHHEIADGKWTISVPKAYLDNWDFGQKSMVISL